MKHYRAYQIDPAGRVMGCINLACDNDEDAKRQAEALVVLHRIELWRLDKQIARFDGAAHSGAGEAERRIA